jgi:hypothetical protein
MTSRPLFAQSVLAVVLAVSGAVAHASGPAVAPPAVPSNLLVPVGNKPFLLAHAVGSQNYSCLPSGSGFAWSLYGPQATLFDDKGDQQITHFLSANPDENGTPRPTWQHSGDTSAVWAAPMPGRSSTDAAYVAAGAIPWLLLERVGKELGPTYGQKMTHTTYIHRVNTAGGMAPAEGCSGAGDVGKKALVPYTADYVFYRAAHGR